MPFPTVPSAPPTFVNVTKVTGTMITVQWGPVDCIHRNGDITGYTVQYGAKGSKNIEYGQVSGPTAAEYNLTRLTSFTTYSIKVAAVNINGTGEFKSVTATTQPSESSFA